MMWVQAFTLMVWFGGGMMAGGALLIVLAFVVAIISIAFGWEVDPWQ